MNNSQQTSLATSLSEGVEFFTPSSTLPGVEDQLDRAAPIFEQIFSNLRLSYPPSRQAFIFSDDPKFTASTLTRWALTSGWGEKQRTPLEDGLKGLTASNDQVINGIEALTPDRSTRSVLTLDADSPTIRSWGDSVLAVGPYGDDFFARLNVSNSGIIGGLTTDRDFRAPLLKLLEASPENTQLTPA